MTYFAHAFIDDPTGASRPGRLTIAWKLHEQMLELGLAWCSPKDQFSRYKGRRIAEGRLESKPVRVLMGVNPMNTSYPVTLGLPVPTEENLKDSRYIADIVKTICLEHHCNGWDWVQKVPTWVWEALQAGKELDVARRPAS